MTWTIDIQDKARNSLAKLARGDARRIVAYLEDRVARLDSPRMLGAALEGPQFKHLWRYRVGEYRIICDIQDRRLVVLVIEIGHRSDIYR